LNGKIKLNKKTYSVLQTRLETMPPPAIPVQNRQRKVRFDLAWVRQFAKTALPECLAHPAGSQTPLPSLEEVAVSILSDRAIAAVHLEFMQIKGPTDVITFDHGEILISAETAQSHAAHYSQKLEHEIGLYIIHGLLHLNGFKDKRADDAEKMRRLQAQIFRKTLRNCEKSSAFAAPHL
jgi:probable rRNA maturation factor